MFRFREEGPSTFLNHACETIDPLRNLPRTIRGEPENQSLRPWSAEDESRQRDYFKPV
jgi:hypothetical protein